MTIIGVVSDRVVTAHVHSQCRLRDQLDRRATTMSSAGLLSGTPTFVPDVQPSFSVTVSDSSAPALTATENIGLSVVRPIKIRTSSPIPSATVGSSYNYQLGA
jgi:hypothetical protein